MLETPDDGMVRYSYGDWGWYAANDTGALEGVAALFWPTQAGLGRKVLPGPLSPEAIGREVLPPVEHALILTVEADDAERLARHLERIFWQNQDSRTYNRSYDLVFVHHPEGYSILNNSNQMVARWLEHLGCRVDGPTILSAWVLEDEIPPGEPS